MGKRYIHLFYIILTSEIAGNDLLRSCEYDAAFSL